MGASAESVGRAWRRLEEEWASSPNLGILNRKRGAIDRSSFVWLPSLLWPMPSSSFVQSSACCYRSFWVCFYCGGYFPTTFFCTSPLPGRLPILYIRGYFTGAPSIHPSNHSTPDPSALAPAFLLYAPYFWPAACACVPISAISSGVTAVVCCGGCGFDGGGDEEREIGQSRYDALRSFSHQPLSPSAHKIYTHTHIHSRIIQQYQHQTPSTNPNKKNGLRLRKKAETVGSLSRKYMSSGMACIFCPAPAVAALASDRKAAWSKPVGYICGDCGWCGCVSPCGSWGGGGVVGCELVGV